MAQSNVVYLSVVREQKSANTRALLYDGAKKEFLFLFGHTIRKLLLFRQHSPKETDKVIDKLATLYAQGILQLYEQRINENTV